MSACPVCSSTLLVPRASYKGLRLLQCRSCHLVFQPDPAQVSYDGQYYDHWWWCGRPTDDVWLMKVRTSRAYLDFLKREFPNIVVPGARLLDIGCAHGFMLQAASEIGLEPYGVDVSPAVEFAAARGYEVQRSNLEDAGFFDRSFDVVTMIDVIEHIIDPVALAQEVGRVVRPLGLVLLLTPNVSGMPVQLLKGLWPHWKAEHLRYYSVEPLARLFAAAGFQMILARRGFKYLYFDYVLGHFEKFTGGVPTSILQALRRALPDRLARRPLRFGTELFVVLQRVLQRFDSPSTLRAARDSEPDAIS